MRIIAGKFKGYTFHPPDKIPARPTTDRAKESLLNILISNYGIENKHCLDLFSGSGSIAYELASNGAAELTAIDSNFFACQFIKQNFEKLKWSAAHIIKADVFKWIGQSNHQYDLIFADPPYDHIRLPELPTLIFEKHMLSQKGLLVIEHRSTLNFSHQNLVSFRDYGQSRFSFFES